MSTQSEPHSSAEGTQPNQTGAEESPSRLDMLSQQRAVHPNVPIDWENQLIGTNRLRNRSLSDPSISLKGGTLLQESTKDDKSEMMNVLLEINTRIQNLELKGQETVTNESLNKALIEIHRPMQKAINTLQTAVQQHEISFVSFENTQLALQNRIKLVDQELKNHIDTTSAEYSVLKTTHLESLEQMKENIEKIQAPNWDESCEQIRDKISSMDNAIKAQEAQYNQITELLGKAQSSFCQQKCADSSHLHNMTRRTHLDDMMRRSVIIEGIHENRSEDLTDVMLQIADVLDIHIYEGEISQARRLGQYKSDLQPRPVKITFIGEIKQDLFLQRKKHLATSDRFSLV